MGFSQYLNAGEKFYAEEVIASRLHPPEYFKNVWEEHLEAWMEKEVGVAIA